MEAIFVGIKWTSGTQAEAVERAKAIVREKGEVEVGDFELVDEVRDGDVVGNLECEEGLYEAVDDGDGAWEETGRRRHGLLRDGVTRAGPEIPAPSP